MKNEFDNKGFTLVELIVVIVLIGLLAGFGTYSIVNVIRASDIKECELLISNIKSAAEVYYQECKYANNTGISCNINEGKLSTTLGNLVQYGYLKSNGDDVLLVNTLNDEDISNCQISVVNEEGKIVVTSLSENCPTYEGEYCDRK